MHEWFKDSKNEIKQIKKDKKRFVNFKSNSALLYNKAQNFWKSVSTWKVTKTVSLLQENWKLFVNL